MYIKTVKIKNFRTLLDFEIELDKNYQIIAGANNSGKSNLLRALNIFFNEGYDDISYYNREDDLSYHILKGTGSVTPTYIEVDLFLSDSEIKKINGLDEFIFDNNIIRTRGYYDGGLEGWFYSHNNGKFPIQSKLKNGENKILNKQHSIHKLFKRIQFIYIPTQYDISHKINQLVADEILPTMVDSYGNTGLSKKIIDLKDKISEVDKLTKEILKEKNLLITENFRNVIKDFPEIQAGINIENYALEVSLTGESLAEILSKRIELNVKDASHSNVNSKGSGIQKLVLITLLEYFSKNIEEKARYTNPFIIWAIDEPETYMQPKLQKKVGNIFKNISKTHQIIITTHSPKMVDIYNPKNVKLFYLENESFPVKRKKNKIFFKKITKKFEYYEFGFIDKLKDHFGVETNDGWIIRDKNIIFEGNDDMIYFHSTFEIIMGYPLDVSNIISNSSEYMPSFVELLYQQISNKELRANTIFCLLDNDESGRSAFTKINKYCNNDKKTKKYIKIFKTESLYLSELDNKNDNYPSMIEDMIIPEIFYSAVSKFLQDKYKLTKLPKYTFRAYEKFRKQSKRTPIMEVLDNYFSDLITKSTKFSFKNLSVKYALSINYKKILSMQGSKQIELYSNKYPNLKIFFQRFK